MKVKNGSQRMDGNGQEWRDEFLHLFLSGELDKVDAAFALKLQYTPSSLFKFYGPSDYAFQGLAEGTVWLASPDTCNDPFDSGLVLDVASLFCAVAEVARGSEFGELKALGISLSDMNALVTGDANGHVVDRLVSASSGDVENVRKFFLAIPQVVGKLAVPLVAKMQAVFQSSLKIACFTEQATTKVLWAYYAASHTGFCVKYPIDEIPTDSPQRRLLFPIFYQPDRFDLTPLFKRFISGELSSPIHTIAAALFKSPEWAHEREWRIINPDGRQVPGFAVPMSKPSAVYVGMKMTSDHREKLARICDNRGIPLHEVAASQDRYDLIL